MTIVVFLIDTSASMNTRCYLGRRITYLDLAKEAVEAFITARLSNKDTGDRYLLLSFEDPPFNLKSGWKENMATFLHELKNLKSYTLTTMASALKNTFDLLNVHRMQSGIDTYGQGRHPFYLESSIIILITDGGKLNDISDINSPSQKSVSLNEGGLPTVLQYTDGLKYPKNFPISGDELTTEPFRWDQRLFTLVLRLPGTPPIGHSLCLVPSDTSPIDYVCEATGGRSYCVTSRTVLMQCIDSIIQKLKKTGVVINFDKFGPDPRPPEGKGDSTIHHVECRESSGQANPRSGQDIQLQNSNRPLMAGSSAGWYKCRKQIYVTRSTVTGLHAGYWPIPESFWPDRKCLALPPRTAHPKVIFTCKSKEPMVLEGLPFDKYELEPSPLTQLILSRKQPLVCWQAFVPNSGRPTGNHTSHLGYPFGYIKASSSLQEVYLVVLPYNYPTLIPLLAELFNGIRSETSASSTANTPQLQQGQPYVNIRPSYEWTTRFNNYMRTIPPYYFSCIKRVLIQKGIHESIIQAIIPDTMDNYLSFTVVNYLKQLKREAKAEIDRVCDTLIDLQHKQTVKVECQTMVQVKPRWPAKQDYVTHPSLKRKFAHYCEQPNEFSGFCVGLQEGCRNKPLFQNPVFVSRDQLLAQHSILRANVFNTSDGHQQNDEAQHALPVGQMGNYQAYLNNLSVPLRGIYPPSDRKNIFGNPFAVDKIMVDEADVTHIPEGSSPNQGRPIRNGSPSVRSRQHLTTRKHTPLSTIASSSQAR